MLPYGYSSTMPSSSSYLAVLAQVYTIPLEPSSTNIKNINQPRENNVIHRLSNMDSIRNI
jgi:hypothetical protein